MEWEMVIGLETHVELSTRTKAFCSCSTAFGAEPNTQCCPVCTGMPGALPVFNRKVLEYSAKAAMALNCKVTKVSRFDRKNYFYPDLPKGYQISQLYLPIGRDGFLPVEVKGEEKRIGIHELHMEEDAGKLIHDEETGVTRVDYNRCGVPLIEIVTEPDFRSSDEVTAYLERLRLVMLYLGISDCKMQEGSLRCDINLSLRPKGTDKLGTRTEMKNLGSFRAVARAIAYESERQRQVLEAGGHILQETRRWDEDRNVSVSMRTKEDAKDYRYFPEPDLPAAELTEQALAELRARIPELAHEKQGRYMRELGLSLQDSLLLTERKALAEYYETLLACGVGAKEGANWIMTDLLRLMKEHHMEPEDLKLRPERLARVITMTAEGRLNRGKGAEVLAGIFLSDEEPENYVKTHGLEQIRDDALLKEVVCQVLVNNSDQLNEYRAGKEKLFGFFVGQCMRQLKGKADPKAIGEALRRQLNG
ncbi:MAG: Asp-tRNA(Asn)/Glu-tRNA(Gln) amidotransferase subunit GatB [Oscillospiraceae bacterium]|nr:Asp-tRNA(Asn)/Glu-tRNA(Gln) amidotransferase subunit GatB [Oscillospiraceae bacterium]